MIKYAQNKEDDFQNKNVPVAAYGRLYLWETLHKLGDRVLYHDTDSIIVSFVALGPKTYSYKTKKGKIALKLGVSKFNKILCVCK